MSVVLQYTYQNSQSMADLNRQLYDLSERLKKAFLECATTEAADTIELQVQQDSNSVSERLAKISLDVNENSAKVNLLATYDTARASVTLSAALVNGIEQSNVTLSGDHIILDGDVTINRGFTLSGDHIETGTITATQIAANSITAAEIASGAIHSDEIYSGAITADKIATGAITADKIDVTDLYALGATIGGFNISSSSIYYSGTDGVQINPYNIYFGNKFIYSGTVIDESQSLEIIGIYPRLGTGKIFATKLNLSDPPAATSSTANLRISDAGNILKISSGSSKRWKNSITDKLDENMDPHKLYDIPVVSFKYNKDYLTDEEDKRYDTPLIGLIAEDVEKNYPQACDYEDGKPSGWSEHYIIPPMLRLIQEHNERIKRLEAHYE